MNFPNILKIFTILSFSLFLNACGGGGGSSSSPVPINFTETQSVTRGLVAAYRPGSAGDTPDVHAEEIGFESEEVFGGFNWAQNADTDIFSVVSDTLYSGTDLDAQLTPEHITSGPVTASSEHTLTSTNYTYGYYDSSIGQNVYVLVGIPANYPNQTWIYWDNTNYAADEDYSLNFAVTGKPLLYASLPSSGTATYTGGMEGYYSRQTDSYNGHLHGASNFSVNWGNETISGSFTNIKEDNGGTITNFNNLTMPSTSIGSGNGGIASFTGDLQGTGFTTSIFTKINGAFFGTNAESIGGTWEIENNGSTGAGAGYFAAGKN